MESFFRYIAYVDYYKKGQKISNVGFLNMGYYIGNYISGTDYKMLLIPITMIIAFFIAIAEPAVVILLDQIEEFTEGGISNTLLKIALASGVSIAT